MPKQGMGDLAPQISEETVKFHYLKHHAGYVKKLNVLIISTELVKTSQGVIYNMSAQIWNHNFYWLGLAPNSQLENAPLTKELICRTFGSLEELKRQYTHMAAGHFGSGWVWLLYDRATDSLKLAATKDADNPMRTLMAHPLLVLDVWEHAYYIDYRNDKAKYTEAWFQKINWERVEELVKTYRIK
ncbi:putative Fe,Mn superoxide dismutase [Babesia divergens]|uniref:Superoxide dismutase n=1 Tax=Babesia divergens TaxID=32595 RepID=A0AAD9LJ71_BABDI|nr:putative Fe,Mn superoxide dismutase [Babesia divergens]